MSFTYGSVQAFALIFAVCSFILGFLFFGRLKFLRFTFWIVGIGFLLLMGSIEINHSMHNNEESQNLIGTYQIKLSKSSYDPIDLTKFSALKLIVKDDHTFQLSESTPFFPSQNGKWDFEDDGDVAFTECTFEGAKNKFQINDGIGSWTFEYYHLVNGKEGDKITFENTDTLWQKKMMDKEIEKLKNQ